MASAHGAHPQCGRCALRPATLVVFETAGEKTHQHELCRNCIGHIDEILITDCHGNPPDAAPGSSHGVRQIVIGLDSRMNPKAKRWNAAKRVRIAAVFERWARQLRFSAEIEQPVRLNAPVSCGTLEAHTDAREIALELEGSKTVGSRPVLSN